ncbi:MAG: hypothetical protein ACI8TQ_000541 [Planctomycetota bacterium]
MKRAISQFFLPWASPVAFLLLGFASPQSEPVRIELSNVQEIEGSARDGQAPRAPALLHKDSTTWLFYRTSSGERKVTWTPGSSIDPSVSTSVKGLPSGKLWLDGIPDELDLAQLPDPSVRVSNSRWRNGRLLDNGKQIGWCPEFIHGMAGWRAMVFDRHDAGDYDVVLKAGGEFEKRLAGSNLFEANATIAVDLEGTVYAAWDEGAAEFGRGGGLHSQRQIRFGVVKVDGFHALPLPEGMLNGALGAGSQGYSMAELPRLVVDEAGVLWFFFRAMARWNRLENKGARGKANTGANRRVVWEWRVAARSSATSGWSRVVTLPQSDGPGVDGLAAVALPGKGLAVVYESDARTDKFPRAGAWEVALSGASRLVALEVAIEGGQPSWEETSARALGRIDPVSSAASIDPDPTLLTEGMTRMWGDLHRHSDLSRCKMDEDGNQLAQYRYGVDIAQLDFLALTEHYQHLTPGQWAYSMEMAERFNADGEFTTLFGFEQAQTDGHRNLFCSDPAEAQDAPFRKWTPNKRFVPYPAGKWIAIPHQLADPKVVLEWPRQRSAVESVVEIYQSRRGSYFSKTDDLRAFHAVPTHPHAVDYLNAGRHFGVVAASDHVTTNGAFTAVYVDEPTRDGLFAALRARRCYAATAKMALDVRLGSLMMGQIGDVEKDAALQVRVAAGEPIARVEVLRNGQLAHGWWGSENEGWLTVRLGGTTRDPRLNLRLENANWIDSVVPFRDTAPDSITKVETGIRFDGELGHYGECGFMSRIKLGQNPVLFLEREKLTESVSLADLGNVRLGQPQAIRIGSVRAEVRLDQAPLNQDRIDEAWRPGDWKAGDWLQVRVVRMDGEMAWSSPIWIENLK